MTQRERIADYIFRRLEKSYTAKTVLRRFASYAELQEFALPQFPVLCMVTGLPVPVEKLSARVQGQIDVTISSLKIECFCYLQDAEEVDSTISDLADELKKKILDDPRQNNLVLDTKVTFDPDVGYLSPFVAFKLITEVHYKHTTGGI